LFSLFDAAIGHLRRYNRQHMQRLMAPGCDFEICRMLVSVGFFAPLANRILLRPANPTPAQIGIRDPLIVSISRMIDRWLAFRFGKSVLMVWRNVAAPV
jgi:hypothetical protein